LDANDIKLHVLGIYKSLNIQNLGFERHIVNIIIRLDKGHLIHINSL